MKKRIIIIGGGFAGVKCARKLEKQLRKDAFDIVVFNLENHMVFHPLLAEVVSAAVQPKDVGAPLRQLLRGVQCRTEAVSTIDFEKSLIYYEAHDGQINSLNYDQLIVTCGNTVNLMLIPGMDEHAYPLKTIGDALKLQAHIMQQLEKAEVCDDPDYKRWYLTFAIVGGGFSGVEVAGEINDLVRSSLKFFNNIKEQEINVIVVHSHEQILPEVNPALRDFARQKMERAGVTMKLKSQAALATPAGLHLKDGSFISTATIVCTIGTTTQPLIDRLNVKKERGRIVVEPDMSIPGYPNAWAIGDCAAVINSLDNSISPPVAQFAERQGTQVAANVVARIKGQPTKPFRFKMLGSLCSIGGRCAVAEIFNIRVSGFPAWFLWRGVYLAKLPSLSQQIQVGLEWFSDLLFPRTLAHLKADRTKRIWRAHYASGDYVFRKGDQAIDFFVIESGEVEVIRHTDDDKTEVVAVLGPGDFFGESSLLDSTTRGHSIRAKSELKCVVLGRNVFTQISSALAPLHEALVKATERRRGMWINVPEVKTILESISSEKLIEPLPMETISIESSVEHVIERMDDTQSDICCIVSDNDELAGVITRSDLVRALEIAALPDPDVDLPVTAVMVRDPIYALPRDPLSVSIATMREHDFKQIIVVESDTRHVPIGRIRIEKVLNVVLNEMMKLRHGEPSVV